MSALGGQRAYLMVLLDLSAAFTASENTMKIGCQGLLSGSKVILAIASKLYELVKNHRAFWYWSVCAPGLRIRACALHCVHILIGSTSFSFYELPFLRWWFIAVSVVSAIGHCNHYPESWEMHHVSTAMDVWEILEDQSLKPEVLLIASKQLPKRINCPSILIGERGVEPKNVLRIVGVLMDRHVSMEEHITSACKSAQFHLFNINRIRKHLTREATEQLIHAFITSNLDYCCNALLSGLPIKQIKRLQRLQNIAARIVTLSKQSCRITPTPCGLHRLPVFEKITFKVLLLDFKCQNNMAPSYLQERIHQYTPRKSLRSTTHHLLEVPLSTNNHGARAFGSAGPRLWNELPLELSLTSFKPQLKTHLFREFYSTFLI